MSSTVVLSTFAILKASCKVGSYLSFSIALIVCLDTLHFFANTACVSPLFLRSIKILFFTTAHPSTVNPVMDKVTNNSNQQIK